jgi:hypothetical protein
MLSAAAGHTCFFVCCQQQLLSVVCCFTCAGFKPAWLQRLSFLWAAFLAHPVVNLPLGATVVGIACAAVGPVRGVLVNELAPLHWLWLGLGWVGAAAAPIATMQIGEGQAVAGGHPGLTDHNTETLPARA